MGRDSEAGLPAALKALVGGDIYPVHRLDQKVGGVMVFARTKNAAGLLSRAVQEGARVKEYRAMVHGTPPEEGIWEDLLWKDARQNKVFVVQRMRKGVREASLDYTVLGRADGLTLVRVRLHTGRTHQIRVQFSSRGLPLLGDIRYGSKAPCSPALWSHRLALTHPVTGKPIDVTCPPPDSWPWSLFAE